MDFYRCLAQSRGFGVNKGFIYSIKLPGQHNVIRVVRLLTGKGTLVRSVVKLVVLSTEKDIYTSVQLTTFVHPHSKLALTRCAIGLWASVIRSGRVRGYYLLLLFIIFTILLQLFFYYSFICILYYIYCLKLICLL